MPSNTFTAYPNLLNPTSPIYAISRTTPENPSGPDSAPTLDLLDPSSTRYPFPPYIRALVQPDTTTQPTYPQTSSSNTPSNAHGIRIASTNPTFLRQTRLSALPNNTVSTTPTATSIATFAPNMVPDMTMTMASDHFNTDEMSSLRAMIQRREARRAKRNLARAKVQRLVLEKRQDDVGQKGQDTKVLEEGVGSIKLN